MTTTEQRQARMNEAIEYAKAHPTFTKYQLAEALKCSVVQAMRSIHDARRAFGVEESVNIAYLDREHAYSLVGDWDAADPHMKRRRKVRTTQDETDLAFTRSLTRSLDPSDPRWVTAATTVANYEASLAAAATLRRHIEAQAAQSA